MKTMTALDVRRKFGSVLELVSKQRVFVTISRAKKPLAVLVPPQDYHKKTLSRKTRFRLAVEKLA